MTPLLADSFQKVAQAVDENREQVGLQEFKTRFGVGFREVRDSLKAIKGGRGIENKRSKAAETILAACTVQLQIYDLVIGASAPDITTLPRPARFTPSEDSHLLHPSQPPDELDVSENASPEE